MGNRPVFWLTAAFCLGITTGRYLPSALWPALTALIMLIVISMIYLTYMTYIKKQTGRKGGLFSPLILAGMILLGAFWYHLEAGRAVLDSAYYGQIAEGEGVIISYPQEGLTRTTFTVRVSRLTGGDKALPRVEKVLLQVKDMGQGEQEEKGRSLGSDSGAPLLPGSRVTFRGTVEEPGRARNPGETDYGEYLFNTGISGIIACSGQDLRVSASGFSLQNLAAQGRNKIAQKMDEILPPLESAQLQGILFGDVDGIAPEIKESYRATGTLHLFAVSGYNVAFVLGAVWFFLGFLRPKPALRLFIAAPLLFGYYLLVGWSASIVRASVMAFLTLLAVFVRLKNDIYTALALAAFFILLVNPSELFLAGFQLSFLATLGIVYFTPFFEAGGVPKILSATLAAQLAAAPLSVYCFNQLSLLAPLVNIFAALLCGFITVLAFLGSLLCWIMPILSVPVFSAAGCLVFLLSSAVVCTSQCSWASLAIASPHPLVVLAAYLAMTAWPWQKRLALLSRRLPIFRGLSGNLPMFSRVLSGKIIFIAGISLLGFLLFVFMTGIAPSARLRVVFLDVGQGDSIFIKTPGGRTVLVDGGGSAASDFAVGSRIVRPYLQRQGLNKVDVLVLTHNHLDHGEGLLELLESCGAGLVLRPAPERGNEMDEALTRVCREKKVEWKEAVAGERVTLDRGIFLEILHPDPGDRAVGNDHSLVMRLCYGRTSWLLTGDAENTALDELMSHCGDLQADVLKLPHHGSRTSFNPAFYRAVLPGTAVVSAGNYSPNQPCREIREYFGSCRVPLLITREKGAILTESDGKELAVRTFIP